MLTGALGAILLQDLTTRGSAPVMVAGAATTEAPPPTLATEPAGTPTAAATPVPTTASVSPATPTPAATRVPIPVATPVPTGSPTATPIIHIVVRGETLSTIADHYRVAAKAIQAANGIVDPNLIVVGERLLIPRPR